MNILLRDAREDDWPALQALFRRSSLSNEGDRAMLLLHPDALELAPSSLTVSHVRIASDDFGKTVGFVTARPSDDGLELDDLFVEPALFRQGVGRALVEDVVRWARGRGVARISVTGNPHALAFYQAVGFVLEGETDTELGVGYRLHLDVGD